MNIDEIKQMKNADMKIIAKQNQFKATIWLADVKKFYETYKYNLGYNRGNNKKPRVNRPAIIIDKQGKIYRTFFLSAKQSLSNQYIFEMDNCKYQYCPKYFDWKKEARIFTKPPKKGKTRFIFIFNEEDLEQLMLFCGLCTQYYIQNIVEQNKKRKRCLMKF